MLILSLYCDQKIMKSTEKNTNLIDIHCDNTCGNDKNDYDDDDDVSQYAKCVTTLSLVAAFWNGLKYMHCILRSTI